jgi:predicted enzyme related to lactoylglutathione lyase
MEGEVIGMEFPSEDIDRAQRFWSGVLGWEFGSGLAEDFDYRMAPLGPGRVVAITPGDLGQGYPNVYMETADIDTALDRVREFGGEAGGIQEIPARMTAEIPSAEIHGRFATCKDSEGNPFCLLQRNPR